MTRRTFAGAVAYGLAAAEVPRVQLLEGAPGAAVPARFAAEACVFTRAYTACPDRRFARTALLSGRFPHAPGTVALAVAAAADAALPAMFVSASRDDSPSEASCHVQLAIRHVRLPRGVVFDAPISTVDVAPTLLGLAGVDVPGDMHGRDLSRVLMSGKGERPESIYAEGRLDTADEWRMMVRGLDKLVVRPNLEVMHLFNLGEDPAEEHDLAREIGYQLKVDEMRALIRRWVMRTGDGMSPGGLRRRK